MATDIKLDKDFDLLIENGDIVINESEMQEVALILSMSRGELKSDPLIGADLTKFMRDVKDRSKLEKHVRNQLDLDDKDYDEIKDRITI